MRPLRLAGLLLLLVGAVACGGGNCPAGQTWACNVDGGGRGDGDGEDDVRVCVVKREREREEACNRPGAGRNMD